MLTFAFGKRQTVYRIISKEHLNMHTVGSSVLKTKSTRVGSGLKQAYGNNNYAVQYFVNKVHKMRNSY